MRNQSLSLALFLLKWKLRGVAHRTAEHIRVYPDRKGHI